MPGPLLTEADGAAMASLFASWAEKEGILLLCDEEEARKLSNAFLWGFTYGFAHGYRKPG